MDKPYRIFISTGEISGDLQGSLLVSALLNQAQARGWPLEIVGLGGARMAAAGAKILYDTRGISSIGLVEALRFVLPTVKLQSTTKKYLKQHPPDLVIFIDYIAANLPFGRYIKRQFQTPTVYYIAPQEWIWSHSLQTTKSLVQISDQMIAIFQDEATYYQQHGANVAWVGHPLVDRIQTAPNRDQARQALGLAPDQLAIALFPASRFQELKSILPRILEAAKTIQTQLPQARFWLSVSLGQYRAAIEAAIAQYGVNVNLIEDSLGLMAAADLAITKSGTVNLELALMNVPQVVMYRVNPLGLWLYQTFLKFDLAYVSPPNIIAQAPIVPELLQDQATAANITAASLEILQNPTVRSQMLAGYERVQDLVGPPGAVERAATQILDTLAHKATPIDR